MIWNFMIWNFGKPEVELNPAPAEWSLILQFITHLTWSFAKPRPLDTLDTEVGVTYDPYELRGLVQIFSIAYYDVQNLVFYSHININQIT